MFCVAAGRREEIQLRKREMRDGDLNTHRKAALKRWSEKKKDD
jgi:hypothetical protein